MNIKQTHQDKIIIYIIVAFVAVCVIAAYVYVELVDLSQSEPIPTPVYVGQVTKTSGVINLSPAASATKAATIATITAQRPQVLTAKQAAAKAAAIRKFLAANGGDPSTVK